MIKSINTSKKTIFVIVVALSLALIISSVAFAAKVQLPEGKEIKVKFPSSIKISSGNLDAGIPLLFNLAEDITIGGKIIVEKGAEGTAVVKESIKASKPGKPGKLTLEFVDLATKGNFHMKDDVRLKVAGTITAEGKGRKLLSYVFIFGLFIKGSQGEISADSIYIAKIAETVILEGE